MRPIIPLKNLVQGVVHTSTWVSPDMVQLYDRYLGAGWGLKPNDETLWKRIDSIPDAELWRTHERRRERLVSFTRRRLKMQLKNRAATSSEISRADEILDPEALTIGFARRFATYKRGALIFKHLDRLSALVNNKDRPVQILFAGKAQSLTDGTAISKTFSNSISFIMKGKTSDPTVNCFSFPSGYSLSLKNTCTVLFINGGFSM